MTATAAGSVRNLPAFQGLSDAGMAHLGRSAKLLSYQLGQTISERSTLPAQAIVILTGQGRLLSVEGGTMVTVGRLQPGSIVGLASLLRGHPCEDVTATCALKALAIPDECIADLYRDEASFRQWCQQQLWPAELIALIQAIQAKSPHANGSLQWLQPALQQGQLIAGDESSIEKAKTNGLQIFGLNPAQPDNLADPLHAKKVSEIEHERFAPRLIGLPVPLVESIAGTRNDKDGNDRQVAIQSVGANQEADIAEDAPERPPRSQFSQGNAERSKTFRVVRGEGPLQETLACFQMLAMQLELPFRSDSIEKVLRDVLRRDQRPNMQICGQLAASLGLHVVAARVPHSECSRLKTPSLMEWDGGFVLVNQSNNNGLEIASPKHGVVSVSPDEVSSVYPDGFDVLLIDRSHTTPEQRFGFSWFLPALKRYRKVLVQVLLASFVVQLFTLANPLLIQVIIDKVINQRSLDTLQVLGVALVVLTLLEGVLGSLKTFLFAETTNRLDQRLGAEVIDHLLRLPLGYFDRRPVGELGTRIGELENSQLPDRTSINNNFRRSFLSNLYCGHGPLQLGSDNRCFVRAADPSWHHLAGSAAVPTPIQRSCRRKCTNTKSSG